MRPVTSPGGTSSEWSELQSIQAYHEQLWHELMDIFRVYRSLCTKHRRSMEHAVARGAMFTLFGAIETACRVSGACSLFVSACFRRGMRLEPTESPQPRRALMLTEELFLRQETEEIEEGTWEGRRRQKFVPLQAALIGYPTIYGRLFGITVEIDKSRHEWQALMRLKQLRDLGAHGSLRAGTPKPETVNADDLEQLIKARMWYCEQLRGLPWIAGVEAQGELVALGKLIPLLHGK